MSSSGFAQRLDFGLGFAAGICIVLLGIALDRMSQGAGRRRLIDAVTDTRGEMEANRTDLTARPI